MANTTPLNLPEEWGIDEEALRVEWNALQAHKPKPLPESAPLLGKLHSEVSDAIAFLADVAATLDSDCANFERFQDTAKAAGLDWTTEVNMPEASELSLDNRLRLDKVHEHLDAIGYLAFQFLRRVGAYSIDVQECIQQALLKPGEQKNWLLSLLPDLDQTLSDEGYNSVSANVLRAIQASNSGEIARAIRPVLSSYKSLEGRIATKIELAEYLRAGWKSPKQWLDIWKEYGGEMSPSTFARRRKLDEGRADRIRCHPDSTAKCVAIHFADLPVAYQQFLQKGPP